MLCVCFVTESRIRSIVPEGRIAKRRSSTFVTLLNVVKIRYIDIKNVIRPYRSIHNISLYTINNIFSHDYIFLFQIAFYKWNSAICGTQPIIIAR